MLEHDGVRAGFEVVRRAFKERPESNPASKTMISHQAEINCGDPSYHCSAPSMRIAICTIILGYITC